MKKTGLLLIPLLLLACNKKSERILSEKEMIEVLSDIQIAEAYQNNARVPARFDHQAITNAVLEKRGIPKEVFDSTLSYYGRNLDQYYIVLDKVSQKLTKLEPSAAQVVKNEQDNVWPFAPNFLFIEREGLDNFSFSFSPENMDAGQVLEWSFRLPSMTLTSGFLGVQYTDGTSTITGRNSMDGSIYRYVVLPDSTRSINRVFGSFSIQDRDFPVMVDSISMFKVTHLEDVNADINSNKHISLPVPRPKTTEKADTVSPEAPQTVAAAN